jgi:hypothetical protein
MREQNRIAEQSQRAWLDISTEIAEWRFDNENFVVHINVKARNIGHSPAKRVVIRPKMVDFAMESGDFEINQFYDEGPYEQYEGHTILPGGEYNLTLVVPLPKSDWKVMDLGEKWPKHFMPRVLVNCTYRWLNYAGQTSGTYAVFAKYAWQANPSPILVDCLDLIEGIELSLNQRPRIL